MSEYLNNEFKQGIYDLIDSFQDEMLDEIGKLVEIPSLPTYVTDKGMNHGPEIIRCLHHTLDLCESLGFKTHNEDDDYGWAEIGDSGPLVCIFIHLDVVPVGEGWTKEPFKLTREGDYLYGRGVLDDKAPAISILYAIKACREKGVEWPCRLRVWFGTNEETGKLDVQMYIRKYGAPDYSFVPDSQFPLSYSELGNMNVDIYKQFLRKDIESELILEELSCDETPNRVPPHARAVIASDNENSLKEALDKLDAFVSRTSYQLNGEIKDNKLFIISDGHVSERWNEPWTGINALTHLVMYLGELDLGKDLNELIGFVCEKVADETDGQSLGIAYHSETADLAMTMGNVKYDDYGLSFNLHFMYPADYRNDQMIATLLRQLKSIDTKIILNRMENGFIRDKNDPFLQDLYKSYCDVTGNSDPIKVCGGTYAKHIPGAIPFGVIFGKIQDICHAPDEHIRIESELMVWTKIYANALLRIAENITEY